MAWRRLVPLAWAALVLGGCKKPQAVAETPPEPVADSAFLEGAWSPALLEGTPHDGGQLVVRLPTEPATLNRLITNDLWLTHMVRPAVYETLMRVDGEIQPQYPLTPCLATGFDVSPDHLTYTFHLRQGVKFHDGQPFTSRDVVATFDKLMDPKVRSQSLRSLVEGLVSWKALDPFTVQFKFKEAHFLASRNLAVSIPIMPSGVIEKLTPEEFNGPAAINRSPIGTGPWRFEKWVTGQEISFVRNPDYWDASRKPHLDRLVFRIVLASMVAYQLMLKGQLDVLTKIQPRQWVQMTEDPTVIKNYRRFRYFTNNYTFVAWNEKRPFFADKRVRLALAELFDQDDFDQNNLYGLELRTECIFYEASSACDPEIKPVAYNVAHAKQLLAEAGWADHDGDGILDKDGVPFRFTLISQTNSERISDMAAVLQQAYQAVGIDMKYRPMEWSVMLQHLQDHDFDATSLGFGDPDVYSDPYELWHSSQAKNGQNWISFSDPEVDHLIEQGRREFDEAKRDQLWRALGREIHEQQPFMMLTVSPELEAVSKRFHGVKPSITYYDFSRWWIAE